jgi:hypothetical protein
VDHYGANERLDVIRTLMERSAIYRRALAPVMLMLGALGIGGGAAGYFFTTQTYLPLSHSSFFALYWMFISMLALVLSHSPRCASKPFAMESRFGLLRHGESLRLSRRPWR